MKGRVDVL
ncbi:hypothetical protein R3I93_022167 [Phoxinus phoxinus]|uniref:Uncharacterized protein n=1 Tax=Phoxinus phoxinus TaxID=58324 RepID=A0AAN9C8S7_9TELE